jgi:cyclase
MNWINKSYVLISITLTLLTSPVHAQDDQFADVVIETTEVANGIYMLMGQGGNIGASIGVDGVFLIDDQFAPLTIPTGTLIIPAVMKIWGTKGC